MASTRLFRSGAHRLTAAALISATALLGLAACDQAQATPSNTGAAPAASSQGSTAATGNGNPGSAPGGSTASAQSTAGHPGSGPAACGNSDLKIAWGRGTVGLPHQGSVVLFINISDHTCALQGYPGAAVQVGGDVVNATRVLNGYEGDLQHLSSPPLVTLAPGAEAGAMLEWVVGKNPGCYPTGNGSFEITAPNTTKTVVIGSGGQIGSGGICSNLEINPVVAGPILEL